jgi:hypothetical protein
VTAPRRWRSNSPNFERANDSSTSVAGRQPRAGQRAEVVGVDCAPVMLRIARIRRRARLAEAQRVLAPDGRLLVLERRSHDTNAAGTASHGWTDAHVAPFAEHGRCHGFVDVAVATHTGPSTLLSVAARRPRGSVPRSTL